MKRLISHVAAALTLVTACAAFADEPIKIGVPGPYTGGSAPMGVSMRDAMRIAVKEINEKGGVMGRPLELVERDDEAKNERGIQVAQELIYKNQIVAAVGVINTGVMLASQRFYQEAKIPIITPGPSGSDVTKAFLPDSYVFRVSLPDRLQAEMIVKESIDNRHFEKVAILADSTNYGQLGRADLEGVLKERGISPVAVEKFNIKDVDMTPQLLRARMKGAQVILTYGVGPELAQIANGMAKLGWKVPMIGSWTLSMPNFADNAGPNAEAVRMPQTFILEGASGKREAFIKNFEQAYGVTRIPGPVWAAQGYDSIYLLAAAIEQAKSTDGTKIKEALEDLQAPVEGLVMTYNKPFSKTDHEAFKTTNVAIMGEIKNGQVVFAYDADRGKIQAN